MLHLHHQRQEVPSRRTNFLVLFVPGPRVRRPPALDLGDVCEPGVSQLLLIVPRRVQRRAELGRCLEKQLVPPDDGRAGRDRAVVAHQRVDGVVNLDVAPTRQMPKKRSEPDVVPYVAEGRAYLNAWPSSFGQSLMDPDSMRM